MKKNNSIDWLDVVTVVTLCSILVVLMLFLCGILIYSSLENIKNGINIEANKSGIFCAAIIAVAVFSTAIAVGYSYFSDLLNNR